MPVFATWLGWLVAPDRPLVIVRDPEQDPAEIVCGRPARSATTCRAMSAASMLARAGRRDVAVLTGGPQDWAESTGQTLEVAS